LIIVYQLSGFLFLFILVLQIVMALLGYILEPTSKHYDSDAKLLQFINYPKRFQIGFVVALIEHFCVIILAIMLSIGFSHYNIILGIVLIIFRVAEGSIQVYIEKDYWGLLDIARKYSVSSDTEKSSLYGLYRAILQKKSSRFAVAMICWSIGSIAFSILLIIYGAAPLFIGWIGIVACIIIGFGNVLKLVKPNVKIYGMLSSIGGLVAILYEVLIGGWLLFFSHFIP